MSNDKWVNINERLPEMRLDNCGNITSDYVLLWRIVKGDGGETEWYDIGYLNPSGMGFETYEEDGPVWVCPIKDVKAWMPLPGAYEEVNNE